MGGPPAIHRRAALLIVVVGALGLAACGGTATPRAARHPVPRVSLSAFLADSTFSFHTLRGAHDVTLQVSADCGQGRFLSVDYDEQRDGDLLSPVFSGPVTCRFAPNLRTGRLAARWGRSLGLNMDLTAVGAPRVISSRPSSGCDATDLTATYRAHGTLEDRVDARALGTFARSQITVSVTTIVPTSTPSPTSAFTECEYSVGGPRVPAPAHPPIPGDTLSTFGDEQIEASGEHGASPELSLNANLPDDIAPGVSGQLILELHGPSLFTATANLTSATLNAHSPFSSGSMTYHARVRCTAAHRATAGRLEGAISIDGPVRATITGRHLGPAALAGPSGDVGQCPGVLG